MSALFPLPDIGDRVSRATPDPGEPGTVTRLEVNRRRVLVE